MKKYLKLITLAVVLLVSAVGLTGCTLINVNPERDNAEVIATVDGKDILKSDYNNNLALVQMNYEASDQPWPTGSSLKTLEENLYDSILQQKVYALKAQNDKEKIDEDKIKKDTDEQINQLQEEVGEDLYEKIITDNYSTVEQFQNWMLENAKESAYATKTTDKFEEDFKKDPAKILDQAVGKINDTDVTRGQYEYRLVGETLNYYMSNQQALPTDQKSMEETNKTIFEAIDKTDANIKYCEDNKITISDDSIKTAKQSLEQNMSMFFQEDSQKEDFLSRYYLTVDEFNKYQENQAKGDAAEDAIKENCEKNAEVSDQDAENYYNDNSKKYDTTKVSAMHILTEDKEAADSIYDEAKDITTKEDFEALVEKYKDVDNVQEATDLGEFDYGTMVPEFSDAAFNAQLNTVLKPVQTEFGYHIIYVYDKEQGKVQKFDEVKDEILTQLKTEKGDEEYNKIEEDITKGAKYDIPDEILSPLEEYAQSLEDEYKVEKFENRIRA